MRSEERGVRLKEWLCVRERKWIGEGDVRSLEKVRKGQCDKETADGKEDFERRRETMIRREYTIGFYLLDCLDKVGKGETCG